MKYSAKFVAVNAVVATLYVVFTMPFATFSTGILQFRPAEALTVLPALFPYVSLGITVGCMVSNVVSAFGLLDVLLGSLTTALACILTAYLCKNKWLAPLPPIVLNATVLPLVWMFAGGLGQYTYIVSMLFLLVSQSVVCYGLGIPLYVFADKKLRPLLELC